MEMEVTGVIAGNAKRFREQRKLTLDAAAALTGVSRSMLAQIEKGDVNPTVSVLWKIANGYKVPFTSLVERHGEAVSVLRQEEVAPLTEDGGRYRNYPLTGESSLSSTGSWWNRGEIWMRSPTWGGRRSISPSFAVNWKSK